MSGIRLELANPNEYSSPKDYIEQHLAPVAAELHRLTSEMMTPGATAEEWAIDMVPSNAVHGAWGSFDQRLHESPKAVTFDGAEHELISKELLRSKQLKVQLSAIVYVLDADSAEFRLIGRGGEVIERSTFTCIEHQPQLFTRTLPFGPRNGSIIPEKQSYILQGRPTQRGGRPVCRRFALSFVYI